VVFSSFRPSFEDDDLKRVVNFFWEKVHSLDKILATPMVTNLL